MKILLLICVIASTTYHVHGKDSECSAPNRVGICKHYTQCPYLYEQWNMYKNATGDERISMLTELRQGVCGITGERKFCCSDCITPDGKYGTIRHIEACPHMYKRFLENKKAGLKYIEKSRIKNKNILDVCCGPDPFQQLDTTQASRPTQPPVPGSGQCGVDTFIGNKIHGGTTTSIDEFPWTVLLEYNNDGKIEMNCGGSLVSDRYVVTAAHCILSGKKKKGPVVAVRVGEFDIQNEGPDCVPLPDDTTDCTPGAESRKIESIIVHPKYRQNDIALIKLKDAVKFTDFVRPICLPTSRTPWITDFIVAGWGRMNDTIYQARYKQAVHVKTFHPKLQDGWLARVCKENICAGGETGKDSCKGDSGGPLMRLVNSDKQYFELAGVVSYGARKCGTPNFPGVYTRVHRYIDWIKQNMK